jgi:hypothetical protein
LHAFIRQFSIKTLQKENKEDSPDAKVPEKDDEADAEPKVEESEEDSNIGQQPPAGRDDQSEQQQQQQLAKDPSDSDLEVKNKNYVIKIN